MANVGSLDRTLRFIVGAILLASPFLPPFAGFFAAWGAWKFAVAAVGVVMLGTAVFRVLPRLHPAWHPDLPDPQGLTPPGRETTAG